MVFNNSFYLVEMPVASPDTVQQFKK